MDAEKQRIKIAKACKWEPSSEWHESPPNYLRDLNAMHEAEKVLTDEQWQKYALWLGPLTTERRKEYIGATAAQRAEAFLRTLGLWEESV